MRKRKTGIVFIRFCLFTSTFRFTKHIITLLETEPDTGLPLTDKMREIYPTAGYNFRTGLS